MAEMTRAELGRRQDEAISAMVEAMRSETMSLEKKFNTVNTEPSMQILGTGSFMPDFPYVIERVTKDGPSVCVHWEHRGLPDYFLPMNYTHMVSDRDVAEINSRSRLFTMRITQKPVNDLMPILDVPYAFQLVLKELPRDNYTFVS
jgi:hypothetical protein